MENIFLERFLYLLNEKFDGNKSKLSKVTGISQSTLSQYSPPRNSAPSAKQIILLSKAFNCSPAYLLGIEDDFGVIQTQSSLGTLDKEEQKLLSNFRELNHLQKQKILAYCEGMLTAERQYKKK